LSFLGIIAQMLVRARKNQPIQRSLRFNLAFQLGKCGTDPASAFPRSTVRKTASWFSEKIMLKQQPKALTANRRHRAEAATNGQGKP
jgi:hypothetical protein